MALPLVHAAAGYLAYEAVRPAGPHRPAWLVGAVVAANAPDLDFLPGFFLGQPDAWHRGVTHTALATVVVAIVALVWARGPTRGAVLAALAYASHLAVDFVSADAVAPHGIPLFWPLSHRYWIAAHPLLGEIIIDRTSRGAFLHSLFTSATLRVWLEEAAVAISAVAAVQVGRGLRALVRAVADGFAAEP